MNIKSKKYIISVVVACLLSGCGGSSSSSTPSVALSEEGTSIRKESMGYFSEYINESLSLLDTSRYQLELSSKTECPKKEGWYTLKWVATRVIVTPEKPDCVRVVANTKPVDTLALAGSYKDVLKGKVIETMYQDRSISYNYTDSNTVQIKGDFLYKKDAKSNKEFSLEIKSDKMMLTCKNDKHRHTCSEKTASKQRYIAELGNGVESGSFELNSNTYTPGNAEALSILPSPADKSAADKAAADQEAEEKAAAEKKDAEEKAAAEKSAAEKKAAAEKASKKPKNYSFDYIEKPSGDVVTMIDDIKLDYYLLKESISSEIMPVTIADNAKNTTIIRLHGGPGFSPYYLYSEYEMNLIENGMDPDISKRKSHIHAMYQHFNLVFWQQRGGFYSTGGSIKEMTLDQMATDLDALIYFIREKYGDSHNIVLSGHSFGGTLAYYYLSHFKNVHGVVAAIIEASPVDYVTKLGDANDLVVSVLESRTDYDWAAVISRLKELKIEMYGSSPNDYRTKIKEMSDSSVMLEYLMFDNLNISDYKTPAETLQMLQPDSLNKTRRIYSRHINTQPDRGYGIAFFTIVPQVLKANFNDKLGTINVPVLLQYGMEDTIAPHKEADTICSKIPSCAKDPSTFLKKYDAGHRVFEEKPKALRADRINFINTTLSQ